MKIKFMTDFRGVETHEVFFRAGEIAEVDDEHAERMIRDNVAIKVHQPQPEVEAPKRKGK
jgi:hypothetical protein